MSMFREKKLLRTEGEEFVKGYIFTYHSLLERKRTTYKVVGRRKDYIEIVEANWVEKGIRQCMLSFQKMKSLLQS